MDHDAIGVPRPTDLREVQIKMFLDRPFSACRCHILVIDYRWGSMGSDRTALARPIDVFGPAGTAEIIYFFCRSAPGHHKAGVG